MGTEAMRAVGVLLIVDVDGADNHQHQPGQPQLSQHYLITQDIPVRPHHTIRCTALFKSPHLHLYL